MLARVKKSVTKKRRQLFNSAVYTAYTILADANLINSARRMQTAEVILITLGLAELNLAVGQSLGRSIQAVINENRENARAANNENNNNQVVQAQPCMRASTHNTLNSTAHIFSSFTFGVLDTLYLTGTIERGSNTSYGATAVRLTGNAAWFTAALVMLFHSLAHDRRQENHPDEDVRAFGIDPSIYDLMVQVLFLVSAFCYLGQRFSDAEINPFGASNIFLWLLANTIGMVDAAYDVHHRNDDEQPEVVINLPAEQSPRVEIVEEEDVVEESSSEVVIESPGGFRRK